MEQAHESAVEGARKAVHRRSRGEWRQCRSTNHHLPTVAVLSRASHYPSSSSPADDTAPATRTTATAISEPQRMRYAPQPGIDKEADVRRHRESTTATAVVREQDVIILVGLPAPHDLSPLPSAVIDDGESPQAHDDVRSDGGLKGIEVTEAPGLVFGVLRGCGEQ